MKADDYDMNADDMPDTLLRALCELVHLILTTTLRGQALLLSLSFPERRVK